MGSTKYFWAGAWEQGITPREPPNGPRVGTNVERIRPTVPNSKLVEGQTASISKGDNVSELQRLLKKQASQSPSCRSQRQSKYLHTGGFSQAAKITHKIPRSLSHSTGGERKGRGEKAEVKQETKRLSTPEETVSQKCRGSQPGRKKNTSSVFPGWHI